MTATTALMVIRLLDILALGMQHAPAIMSRYSALRDKVKSMVEEGRDPTPEERAELDAETDEIMAQLGSR